MHRAGVLGDEEEYVVALALRVGVVMLVGGCDPSATRAAVERFLWLEAVLLPHTAYLLVSYTPTDL